MKNITGYILAGGKSSRMGEDKGFVSIDNEMFIQKIVYSLKPLVDKIVIISSNTQYNEFCEERIKDLIPNKGPVGGIATALTNSKTEKNIILSVDIPLITTEVLKWLIDNHKQFDISQVCHQNKEMPLIAMYNKSLKEVFIQNLHNNTLKLMSVVHSVNYQNLEIPESWATCIQNINTKEDLGKMLDNRLKFI